MKVELRFVSITTTTTIVIIIVIIIVVIIVIAFIVTIFSKKWNGCIRTIHTTILVVVVVEPTLQIQQHLPLPITW